MISHYGCLFFYCILPVAFNFTMNRDVFDLLIGSNSIPCRIEYDYQWYVIMPGARFNLRIGNSYKVEI
ncbi:DUF5348 domain-containing protein [Zhaonella formicivorans]|uniref:DUF5348 domain-containing protein n=1 Tax=Zhaonella formicivorans TaxID=2528593 RepID=UPI003BF5EAE0